MQIQILNSFRGDANKDVDTSTEEGRQAAAKLVGELIRSGSAIFLEREVDGETKTYRVTGYDPETDRLKITLPIAELAPASREDPVIAAAPLHRGRGKARRSSTTVEAHVPSGSGRAVSVAPVSGGLDDEEKRELSWAAVRYGVEQICRERGWHHGCPMPSATDEGHRLIVARGAPLGDRPLGMVDFGMKPYTHVCRDEDLDEDPPRFINSWTPSVVRTELYRDSKGTMKVQIPYTHSRLMMWLDTMRVRAGAVVDHAGRPWRPLGKHAAQDIARPLAFRDLLLQGPHRRDLSVPIAYDSRRRAQVLEKGGATSNYGATGGHMTETQRSMMQRSADGCYRKAAELDRQAHALELEAAEYRRSAECLEETIARAQEAGNFRLTEKGEDHGGTTEVRQSGI